jgi:two-component system, chemotaxis family, sensor kinase Cph1
MSTDASAQVAPLPWEGQTYSVKRHGVTITNCDTEPVRTPGCIQAHGVLLVLRRASLTVAQASENAQALLLGNAAAELLEKPVSVVVGEDAQVQLRAFLACEPTLDNPLYVFSVEGAQGRTFDVCAHTHDDAVLLEFEPGSPDRSPDYYGLVKKTVARLQGAKSLQDFCDLATDEIRALTGFDRVMVYKFHADGHGEVFAESKRRDLPGWRGLHYPAQDIPLPAREVFKRTWLRPVPDVAGQLAEMVPLAHPDSGSPVDMTYCALRGASVMYTEYLKNMHVKAGATLSIRRDDELWGLIACHHYAGTRYLSYPMRAACEFVAQVVSLQHRAAEEREHLQRRLHLERIHQQIVLAASPDGDITRLVGEQPSLLDALDAGGVALLHAGRWSTLGQTPQPAHLDALAQWLATREEMRSPVRPVYVTDHLAADYPPGADFTDVAAGLLAVPLSRQPRSLVIWFRPETIRTVNWGGNPQDKPSVVGPHGSRLTPRRSFELFAESVRQRSLPWQTVEVEAVARLRSQLLELVIARAERLAKMNVELVRSNDDLDAFAYVASHDLKEPLRGIHKYAHQLLQEASEPQSAQRSKLEGLLRLTVRMDSLIDSLLHFSRVGRQSLDLTRHDLNEVIAEAVEMVEARREESKAQFVVPRPLPAVRCDWVRCREIYVNLLANALKYNDSPVKRVEIGFIAPEEAERPRCPPDAREQTIFYVRDNGIGIDPRHFDQVFRIFKRLHVRDAYGGGSGAGLAIVKKLVERHGGQVWIDSTPGQGASFFFTLSDGQEAGHV